MIYGLHPVKEAVAAGKPIDKIFIQKGLKGSSASELIQLLQQHQINYKTVPVEKLHKLTRENHQGVVAFISPIVFKKLEEILEKTDFEKPVSFLLLDGITDTRNFGAIIRTAVAAEVQAIIIPENNSAPVNDEVVKTSAGGIFNIPIAKVKHLKDAVFLLQSYDIKIFSATEKTNNSLYNTDLKQHAAIIMGSEGKGVQKSLLNMSEKIKIPMSDKIDSLNVSVACGVILFEMNRQRARARFARS